MPKAKYHKIYNDLRNKIENEYEYGELLPTEKELTKTYQSSRNTVRRAITKLASEGYVQSVQGMGVRNIYEPTTRTNFKIGEIESFREASNRNGLRTETKVIEFNQVIVDEKMSKLTSFPEGATVFKITRVHYINGVPLIINHNYFLKDAVGDLTVEIASHSIYDYLENVVKLTIINAKQTMYIDYMTEEDQKYIDMGDYNCMAVVSSNTYNSDGVMFEYTESRHHPTHFRFHVNALRKPQ